MDRPDFEDNDLSMAVRWKIKDLIEMPLAELVVDAFAVPEDAYRGAQKKVYVVAIRDSSGTINLMEHGDLYLTGNISATSAALPTALPNRALLATGLLGTINPFRVSDPGLSRNAMVEFNLQITEAGESIVVTHEAQLRNVP